MSSPSDTIRLGIFGWPVGHSKSPEMHLAAAKALGIAMTYERFAVPPDELVSAVEEKRKEGIRGFNVTLPHKESIIDLLDEVDSRALAIGAVNTVIHEAGYLVGHNTDAPGLVRSLEEAGVSLKDASVVIIGAGGAARAAAVGLADVGAASIQMLARRPDQAEAVCKAISPHLLCEIRAASLDEAKRAFSNASILVQATSATLADNPSAESFADSLPFDKLPEGATVVDLVYDPRETAVLRKARTQGLKVVDGLGMLLHQGALAFEYWTGRMPPLDVMRYALEADS